MCKLNYNLAIDGVCERELVNMRETMKLDIWPTSFKYLTKIKTFEI